MPLYSWLRYEKLLGDQQRTGKSTRRQKCRLAKYFQAAIYHDFSVDLKRVTLIDSASLIKYKCGFPSSALAAICIPGNLFSHSLLDYKQASASREPVLFAFAGAHQSVAPLAKRKCTAGRLHVGTDEHYSSWTAGAARTQSHAHKTACLDSMQTQTSLYLNHKKSSEEV